jgi:inorganic pyrophosphatase
MRSPGGIGPAIRSTRRPPTERAHTRAMPDSRPPIEVIIEIPSGSRNKYEFDHVRNRFVLDRILYSSVVYPCDYGFIESSLADDGDPLDVLVLISERTFPGCVVRGRPIGVLDMRDDKGHDYKVLAVAHDDPRWDGIGAMQDVSPHLLREIENFFDTYKALEGRETQVSGWLGLDDAWRIIDAAVEAGRRGTDSEGEPAQPGTWR